MFFLKRLKALISSSSSKPKYAPLSPLSFHTVWLFFVKCQKSKLPFRFFYMFQVCLPSHSCYTLLLKEMQAGNAKKNYTVFTNMHENGKNNTKTHRFLLLTHRPCMWPAFATHLKGSQVRTHAGPDLSEASRETKNPEWQGNVVKLLRRWSLVVMGQVGPNVKSQPTSNVDVHRFSFSPIWF